MTTEKTPSADKDREIWLKVYEKARGPLDQILCQNVASVKNELSNLNSLFDPKTQRFSSEGL